MTLSPQHFSVLEETLQVLQSAAEHNRSKGRTVFAYCQQDRADRLKEVIDELRKEEK